MVDGTHCGIWIAAWTEISYQILKMNWIRLELISIFLILGIRSIRRTVVKFVQASQYNSVHLTYVTVLSSPVADIWKQVKKENMQKVELLQN